ncbi:MAG: hypothetical protein AAGI90_06800, partial [Chlamydiota bacterium]
RLTSKIIYKAMKKDSPFTNPKKIEKVFNKITDECRDLTKKFLQDIKAETKPAATTPPDKPEDTTVDYKVVRCMFYFSLHDTLKHVEEKAIMECCYNILLTGVATIGAITPLACLSGTVAICVAISLGILATAFAATEYKHLDLVINFKKRRSALKIRFPEITKNPSFTNPKKIEKVCNKIVDGLHDLTKKFLQDIKDETNSPKSSFPFNFLNE